VSMKTLSNVVVRGRQRKCSRCSLNCEQSFIEL
jgi:hypothetical protein